MKKEEEGLKKKSGKPDYNNHLFLNDYFDTSVTYNFYFFYFTKKSEKKVSSKSNEYWAIKVSDGVENRRFITFIDFEFKEGILYKGLIEQNKENLVHIQECSEEVKKQISELKEKEKKAKETIDLILEEEYADFKKRIGNEVTNLQARKLYKKELNYDQFDFGYEHKTPTEFLENIFKKE